MNDRMFVTLVAVFAIVGLPSCTFMAEQLADKAREEQLLRPGALDVHLSGYYDTYVFKFMGTYLVRYKWPAVANFCSGHGGLRTIGNDKERYKGEIFFVSVIYEKNGKTFVAGMAPIEQPHDFDRYVRSVKYQSPVFAPVTQAQAQAAQRATMERIKRERRSGRVEPRSEAEKRREVLRYEEKEVGFQPICAEFWVGTNNYLRARLHQRDLATWKRLLSERVPEGQWSERRMGVNTWLVQEVAPEALRPRPVNGVGGPYQFWLLPIGDTGYTLGFELGASLESLQHPLAQEHFRATFRHLIESVGIEPWTEKNEAEHEALKQRALALIREDCRTRKNAQRFPACRHLLQ